MIEWIGEISRSVIVVIMRLETLVVNKKVYEKSCMSLHVLLSL